MKIRFFKPALSGDPYYLMSLDRYLLGQEPDGASPAILQ